MIEVRHIKCDGWLRTYAYAMQYSNGCYFFLTPAAEEYSIGARRPNYPVPITVEIAVIATLYDKRIGQWAVEWTKRMWRKQGLI